MKKKIIIPVSPIGILSNNEYYSKDPQYKRRKALNYIYNNYKYKDIISRLNAVAIRFKNRDPKITENIRKDMAYLKEKHIRVSSKK